MDHHQSESPVDEEDRVLSRILCTESNYYDVLGIEINSSKNEVVRAYRKLALKFHPDSYKGRRQSDAYIAFQKINEAIEVLRDDNERERYDRSLNRAGTDHINPSEPFSSHEYEFPNMDNVAQSFIRFLHQVSIDISNNEDIGYALPGIYASGVIISVDFLQFFLEKNPSLFFSLFLLLGVSLLFIDFENLREKVQNLDFNSLPKSIQLSLIDLMIQYYSERF